MSGGDGPRVRILVALFPPAWRVRYADEFGALLADTGPSGWAMLDVLAAALGAWLRPPARLHDRAGRMRATVGVTLCAWTVLAAGAVLFAKLTTDGAAHGSGRGGGWYDVFVGGACVSVLAISVAWLPLVVAIARRARQHGRVAALLAAPVVLPLPFLVAAAASAAWAPRSAPPGAGVAAPVFVLLAGLGVAIAAGCGAGPALALARTRPDGPVRLTVAVAASACATAAMAVAATASVAYQVARAAAAPAGLTVYGLAMAAALAVAAVSGVRGLRAVQLDRSACAG
ncbi:hypothetical protein [Dactylosporangium sp. NPDC048998]|uniref:hypothetical protein n=1 Tax=Dactylosporangium sp. NPDC048998 TaxID=3363976 RepID=UPI00371AA2C5